MTTNEYLQTPETLVPTELVYGVLRVAESPMPRHQVAVGDFFLALHAHVQEKLLGQIFLSPLDVILDSKRHLVVQPDLLFISNARSHILSDRIHGAPDWVMEVLSPHPRIGKLDERLAWFAEYGVRECWLLHQLERRYEIVSFADGRIARRESFDERVPLRSDVFPEFDRTPRSILSWDS